MSAVNTTSRLCLVGLVLALCLTTLADRTYARSVKLGMRLEIEESSRGESALTERLYTRFATVTGLEVAPVNDSLWEAYSGSEGFINGERMARLGLEMGARYVLSVTNVSIRLRTRRGLSIPVLLSRYKTVGSVTAIVRLVDTEKGRIVWKKDFEVTKGGPSQWQPLADNPHSPGLRISASDKPMFMEALEWRAADELIKLILEKMKFR